MFDDSVLVSRLTFPTFAVVHVDSMSLHDHKAFSSLQILNYVAGGRDVSTNISFMCQTIIRGPAAPLVKKLAYDVVHAAPLSDSDWSLVIEGLRSDIVGTFSLEVNALHGSIPMSLERLLHSSSRLLRSILSMSISVQRPPQICL